MSFIRIIFGGLLACFLVSASWALETRATAALVVDQGTGTVLLAKDPDRPIPPASMSKLMTLNMLFEALQSGRVTMDTEFLVSQKAHEMGGSKMFVSSGSRIKISDLLRGIIVQSGNDACVVVAENLAGTEEEFARMMTLRAAQLGMVNSNFANSTGWPHPEQRMSARDLVFLADRIIKEFPEYYPIFAETSFTWADITQENRNPLLSLGIGADGLKTGHTSEAGYGLVGSARQGNRRVTFMISGLDSVRDRAEEAEKIANWAFRQFTQKTLLEGNKRIAEADVWLGKKPTVGLIAKDDIIGLIPYTTTEEVSMSVVYDGPLEAPIAAGDDVAKLRVDVPGMEPVFYPLYAEADVGPGGVFTRFKGSARVLARRAMETAFGSEQ
jgi:D-alanyl-D-alanine carboxypeptidase (penicillin-binding protein 5/6)